MNALILKAGHQFNVKNSIDTREFYKQFIPWDSLLWIESYNSSTVKGNNNIKLHLLGKKSIFICRGSLTNIMKVLPEQFVRINKYQLINRDHITHQQGINTYFMGGSLFKLGKSYTLIT